VSTTVHHMYVIIFDMNFCYLDLERHFAEIRQIEAAKRKLFVTFVQKIFQIVNFIYFIVCTLRCIQSLIAMIEQQRHSLTNDIH